MIASSNTNNNNKRNNNDKNSSKSLQQMSYGIMTEDDLFQDRVKRRAPRLKMTTEQIRYLEQKFYHDEKPSACTKRSISDEIGVSVKRVQIWFQNKRAKLKAQNNEIKKRSNGNQMVYGKHESNVIPNMRMNHPSSGYMREGSSVNNNFYLEQQQVPGSYYKHSFYDSKHSNQVDNQAFIEHSPNNIFTQSYPSQDFYNPICYTEGGTVNQNRNTYHRGNNGTYNSYQAPKYYHQMSENACNSSVNSNGTRVENKMATVNTPYSDLFSIPKSTVKNLKGNDFNEQPSSNNTQVLRDSDNIFDMMGSNILADSTISTSVAFKKKNHFDNAKEELEEIFRDAGNLRPFKNN